MEYEIAREGRWDIKVILYEAQTTEVQCWLRVVTATATTAPNSIPERDVLQ